MLKRLQRPPRIEFSPYEMFTHDEWAKLRADTPMTLTDEEVDSLSGVIERISRRGGRTHLSADVAAVELLCGARSSCMSGLREFLRKRTARCRSSSASPAASPSAKAPRPACCARCWRAGRTIRASTWCRPMAFCCRTTMLEARGLMNRKGFPESFDQRGCCNSWRT